MMNDTKSLLTDDSIRKRTDACVQASPENESIGFEACSDVIKPPAPGSQSLPISLPLIVYVCPLDREISTRQKVKLKHIKAAVNGNRRQSYRYNVFFYTITILIFILCLYCSR